MKNARRDHHGDQPDQKVANYGDEVQQESQNPERRHNHHADQKKSQTLKGMEAHEAVLLVRLDEKEHNRRQKEVSQGASQRLRKHTHHPMRTLDRKHGAAAAWAVSGSIGHLSGAMGTRDRHEFLQAGRAVFLRQSSQTP